MARPKVTLYVDIVSPFAYLAYYVTRHASVFKKCDMTYVPIFLGGVMKACDNRPPMQIKNKDKWIEIERLRWAKLYNIPVSRRGPDGFPVLTLTIQRALTAISMSQPDKLTPAIDALYHAFWVERNEAKVDQPEGLTKLLSSVLDGREEAKRVLQQAGSAEVKKLLNDRGNEAFNEGCFGLPFFVATNAKGEKECYWGFDHIGQLLVHLGLERLQPLNGGDAQNAQAML